MFSQIVSDNQIVPDQKIVSILKEVSVKLEEAQENIQKCDQIHMNELEEKLKIIAELELKIQSLEDRNHSKSYLIHKEKILEKIKNSGNFELLLKYESYDVSVMEFINLRNVGIFSYSKIMNHLLNYMDFETQTEKGWRPIHYICKYPKIEIIKPTLEKKVNLDVSDALGIKPIHLICSNGGGETIPYFMKYWDDLETETKTGMRPIHCLCRNYRIDLSYKICMIRKFGIEDFIAKGVDLEAETINGWRPIHYLCANGHFEMIRIIKDKVDLTCVTKDGHTIGTLLMQKGLEKK